MTTSLYDMSVATYLQTVSGAIAVLEEGEEYAKANGQDPSDLVAKRFSEDMWPLHEQVVSIVHHSVGAVKGLKAGEFRPPAGYPENMDYAGLRAFLDEAMASLQAETADDINARAGQPVFFRFGEVEVPFTAENFVLSFSLPNLFFHATTAYALLRSHGVALGKRQYLGRMRAGLPE